MILNWAGSYKLAQFVGVKQRDIGRGLKKSQQRCKRMKAINFCLKSAKHSHMDSPGRSPGNREHHNK